MGLAGAVLLREDRQREPRERSWRVELLPTKRAMTKAALEGTEKLVRVALGLEGFARVTSSTKEQ